MNIIGHRFGMVAIIGPPNAGKSTLLNRLLGQKIAIVTPKPQTTRNRIAGIVTQAGFQMVLVDTPGLHKARDEINRRMVRVALDSLAEADVALLLVDGSSMPARSEKKREEQAEELRSRCAHIQRPVVLVLNKSDLVAGEQIPVLLDWYRHLHPFSALIPVSALHGTGMDELMQTLVELLPPGPAHYPDDMPTDATERFIAAEIIREKVFLLVRDEVPYSTGVLIESFAEGDPVVLHAAILVERDSQKGILIGRRGRMLAAIREQATAEIEEMLDCRVRLHLWIKVRKNWTTNPQIRREMGLE
ncbi:MAG: GTPase Era [Desulfobulbus sp.]